MVRTEHRFVKADRNGYPEGGHWEIWEEVPDEDLMEDGEITKKQASEKIFQKVMVEGNWKLIRTEI